MQDDSTAHDPYAALRCREYRLYVAGAFLAVIGGQIQSMTAAFDVYERTGSAMSLGFIGGVIAAPMLALALPAGQFADSHSRKGIVMVTQLVAVLCALGLSALAMWGAQWPHAVGATYGLLALASAGATVGRPARSALLPALVPQGIFTNAVTWNTTVFECAGMIGPAIGGFLCAWSVTGAYFVAAVCWTLCILFAALLPDPPIPRDHPVRPGWAGLLVGLKFVCSTRLMFSAMLLDLFAVLLGGSVYLLPAVAKDILHVGPTGFGWLRAAPAFGAATMALIQAHRRPFERAGRVLLLAVAGFGAATIVFGLSRSYWLSFAMLALTGMCDNISVVVRHTLVQMLTPDAMRGRVSAVNQIFIGSSNEIGGMESGIAAKLFGLVGSIVFGGVGTIVVVASIATGFPELRRLGSLKDIKPIDVPEPDVLELSAESSAPAQKAG